MTNATNRGVDAESQLGPEPLNPTTPGQFVRAFSKYTSPRILTALALGLIGFRIYLGNWSYADLIAPLCVLLFWPLLEWLIHAYLLHMKPFRLFGRTLHPRLGRPHRAPHSNPAEIPPTKIGRTTCTEK